MDKPRTGAKDFFFWAGAMIAFYWSVIAYVYLVFDYINYAFPNPLSYYPQNPYDSGISFEMASVIVLLPLFLLLMWLIHKDADRDPSRNEIWVRRWAIIFTLFVAGISMAADVITLLTTFLSGEALTAAFLLKVLVVLLVAAGVFMHFIADLRGYWEANPSYRKSVRVGVGILAVATIVAGFFIVGSPREARLQRFDAQRVNDLVMIQSQLLDYWRYKQALPMMLQDLQNGPYSYGSIPLDPETGKSYEYTPTGPQSFELCSTFHAAGDNSYYSRPVLEKAAGTALNDWQHDSGRVCFKRVIDPALYPPITK